MQKKNVLTTIRWWNSDWFCTKEPAPKMKNGFISKHRVLPTLDYPPPIIPARTHILENWSGSSTSGLPFRSLGMTPNLELQGAISPSETNNPQRLIWDLHCSKSNYTAALASKCAGYSGSMLWGGKQCSINQFLSYKLSRQHQQFIVNMCCQIEPTQQRAHVMPPTHKGG